MILSSLTTLCVFVLTWSLTIIKFPQMEPVILNQIQCNNGLYFSLEEMLDALDGHMEIKREEKFLRITLSNRSAYLFENSTKIVTDRAYSMGKPFLTTGAENCIPYDGVLMLLKFFYDRELDVLTMEELKDQKFTGLLNFPQKKNPEKLKIIIDAGHGGDDSGTRNESGIMEKDITLDISLALGELLEDNGFDVIYTRNDDVTLPLPHRLAIANSAGGDLLISIHVNNSKNENAKGLEVFFLNSTSSDEETNELAIRENEGYKIETFDPIVSNIMKDLNNTRLIMLGKELAEHVYISAEKSITTNRGVKQAPFYILSGAKMPGVLVEVGFLSNREESLLLEEQEYREYLAGIICDGIKRFISQKGGSFYAEKGK